MLENILKYYVITITIFVLGALLLSPVENYFLSTSTGFISTILKLGLLFVIIITITSTILYLISNDARNLFKRVINLIKRKLKK